MARRRYSDRERAEALAALAANGGNLAQTARQLDIPRKTLAAWQKDQVVPAEVAELRHQKKEALADRLEALAHQLVDAVPNKIGSATLQACAVSLGIAVEKMRLLREQPTSIGELDLKRLTNEQLLQFDALLATLGFTCPDRSGMPRTNGESSAAGPGGLPG